MNKELKEGFKSNIKEVVKQSGPYPYLTTIGGLIIFAVGMFLFGIAQATPYIWMFFVGILVFGLLMVLLSPIIYGTVLAVSEGTRFKGHRKWNIKTLFSIYYQENLGALALGTTVWKTLLTMLLSLIITGLIGTAVLYSGFRGVYDKILEYLRAVLSGNSSSSSILPSGSYEELVYYTIVNCMTVVSLLISTWVANFDERRNECVIYCSSCLVTDNKINLVSRPLLRTFRIRVLPVVKKEHTQYYYSLFYIADIIYFVVFIGSFVGFSFIKGMPYFLMPYLAFIIALLVYSPFYYYIRVYDALFYIAYQDKIMDRLDSQTYDYIQQGRKAMNNPNNNPFENTPIYQANDKEETEESDYNNQEGEKGAKKSDKTLDDGTIDFTNDKKDED